jgi:hypothetical protein
LGQFTPLKEVALRGSAQYCISTSARVKRGKAERIRIGMRKPHIFKAKA